MQLFLGSLLTFFLFNSTPYVENEIILWLDPSVRPQLELLEPEYIGGALTVKTQFLGIAELDDLNEELGAIEVERLIRGKITELAKEYELDLLYIVRFSKPVDVPSYIEKYENLSVVKGAFPNEKYPIDIEPDDPYFGPDYWTQQWHLVKIQAPDAWDITTGDPSIAVGPVDSGVDWDHPDIYSKLWVNPGEDLNGNGVFDYPDDINGVDDDGNGYIDDVIGFDFMGNDWDPSPWESGNDHGTHVFGIAVAATNNGIGVAGVGWDVRGMAFKCGDGQYIYTSPAINAIYYAANQGAVSTNHSYGGSSFNPSVNAAIQYAHNMGVTVVASAGNDNSSLPHYPSGYANVIGVAATGYNDMKADFSNYGSTVDVCAPGTNIWSTVPGGGYSAFDGTSMSSPIVCGLAGLVRSLHPTWSSFQVDSAIMWGCDNIDSINPNYAGQLGWGRVNAWKTLALSLYPYIEIVDYWFDGDGRPEPGEVVKLYLRLTNWLHWQDASDVVLTLSTDDPDITILDNTISVSSLLNGDTLEPSDYFEMEVGGDVRFSDLYVSITSNPQSGNEGDTFHILIGYPEVVLVNDGEEGDPVVDWYRLALDELGVVYEEWNADEGLPESFNAHQRTVVIWFTGNDSTEVLSAEEIDSLISFLNSGGNLFISSQYLAEDSDAQSFITDYLKADIVELDLSYKVMRGYSGDPVGDSLYIKLYGSGGAANCLSPDKVTALSGADTVLYYTAMNGSGNYGPGAVRYSGNYKSIYFAFPFEAIDDNAAGRNTKADVLGRVLSWFGIVGVEEREVTLGEVKKPLLKPTITDGRVILEFGLDRVGRVEVSIYDATGRRVGCALKGVFREGIHAVPVDLSYLPHGIYFLKFEGNREFKTLKLVKIGR
jgi:subtilisin family serine protease